MRISEMENLLITWSLSPYTGWGLYGIQLAQALITSEVAQPLLCRAAERSIYCDFMWLQWLDQIEKKSLPLIKAVADQSQSIPVGVNCKVVIEAIGNRVYPQEFQGEHRVGVAFFECSRLDSIFRQKLEDFELVVTGSRWNQRVMERSGFARSVLVHQGIDTSCFNPIPLPRLLKSPFVLFAGGKLEARKGQDVVVEAFKRFLPHCPDAMLIACWANVDEHSLKTIQLSPFIKSNPISGKGKDLHSWLITEGIPHRNLLVPSFMPNSKLSPLIKQADAAVFTSRCEGGTNLMAMEALACGLPTVLSANTGHQDLLGIGLDHAIGVGMDGIGRVQKAITDCYGGDPDGDWGETDPDALVDIWCEHLDNLDVWRERGQAGGERMLSWSWKTSMDNLLEILKQRKLL